MKRVLCICALAAAFGLLPAIGISAEARPSAATVDLSKISIDNFGAVNTAYYRGGQPTGRDYDDLSSLGIKLIIDLQADGSPDEQRLVEAAGMRFSRIPMTTQKASTSEQLALFLKLVNDPANQPVYVHCAGGRHRTGVMTAVYRMTHDRWTADRAFKEMKEYKFGADFLHPVFKEFVYAYRAEPGRPSATQPIIATAVVQ